MSEVFLSVDPELETAPFAQIIAQLRGFIERGDLGPGDPLPTVRQLAGDLGVAPNTVARAYAELQRDGWLESAGRNGTRVAAQTPLADRRTRIRLLRESLEAFLKTLAHRGYSSEEVALELRRLAKLER